MPSLSLTRLLKVSLCLAGLTPTHSTLAQADNNRDHSAESTPGFELGFSYDAEAWRNTGGIAQDTRYLDLLTVDIAVDGAALLALPSLSLYASALYGSGHEMNDALLGTVQGISNIEANRALCLYETWAEWLYGNGAHSLKLGLYDLNSEFDAIDAASLFINPSHGIGPDFSQSGRHGPSIFPVSSLALRSLHSNGPWRVQLALLDGVPGDPEHDNNTTLRLNNEEGVLAVLETGYISAGGRKIAAGYWQYSAQFEDLQATNAQGEPLLRRGNGGWYGFAELPVWAANDTRGALNVFMRYGQANSHLNTLKSYLGVGAVYAGLLTAARTDRLGLALAIANAGNSYRLAQASSTEPSAHRESIVELTYLLPLTSWLTMQPDVQYIRNAGLSTVSKHSWAFGLRMTLDYGWQF